MRELPEGHPGEDGRDDQEAARQVSRPGCGIGMMCVLVMAVIIAMVCAMTSIRVAVRFDRRAHHAERIGAEKPGKDGADQGKEYDELIHDAASALHEIDVFNRDRAA